MNTKNIYLMLFNTHVATSTNRYGTVESILKRIDLSSLAK